MQLATTIDDTVSLISEFTIVDPQVNVTPSITILKPTVAQTWNGGEETMLQYTSQVRLFCDVIGRRR